VAKFLHGAQSTVGRDGLAPRGADIATTARRQPLIAGVDVEREGVSRVEAGQLQAVVPSVGLGQSIREGERVRDAGGLVRDAGDVALGLRARDGSNAVGAVETVVDRPAGGIGDAGDLVGKRVGVGEGVRIDAGDLGRRLKTRRR
jgi:hypothetical protein